MLKMQHAPSQCDSSAGEAMETVSHASPLGTICTWWSESGLFRLSWEIQQGGQPMPLAMEGDLANASGQVVEFDRLLQAFFSGEPSGLRKVRVDPSGWTSFFADVYQACREIPAGETRRYAELAAAVGRPRAVRAVGQAMARNRVPLVIPCHRVIGSDGRLRGFSAPGGLEAKRTLLDLEQTREANTLAPRSCSF